MDDVKNVIELKNVTKDYGDFKLDDVSFAVPEGSVCGFIGQNGAGKTTTINLILDIIKRDSGEIKVFDTIVDKDSASLREDIGVVFDEMGFHEFMTGKDINIMMKNVMIPIVNAIIIMDIITRMRSLPAGAWKHRQNIPKTRSKAS